jgi:hypothetical protein
LETPGKKPAALWVAPTNRAAGFNPGVSKRELPGAKNRRESFFLNAPEYYHIDHGVSYYTYSKILHLGGPMPWNIPVSLNVSLRELLGFTVSLQNLNSFINAIHS